MTFDRRRSELRLAACAASIYLVSIMKTKLQNLTHTTQWQLAYAPRAEAIAVDGKTLRGAQIHLFSAFLHTAQAVVSQKRVPEKTNEITCLPELLEKLPLEGKVVTADALHTQQATARHLVQDRGADYVLVVKDNQPTLRQQCQNRLPQPAFSP